MKTLFKLALKIIAIVTTFIVIAIMYKPEIESLLNLDKW